MPGYLEAIGKQVCVTSPELEDPVAFRELVGAGADVYVTVDVDVLDRVDMSATGYPAELGLPIRQLLQLIDQVAAQNSIIGFDLVEFAADRDDRDPKTLADAQRAALIFLHLLAWVRRQADDA